MRRQIMWREWSLVILASGIVGFGIFHNHTVSQLESQVDGLGVDLKSAKAEQVQLKQSLVATEIKLKESEESRSKLNDQFYLYRTNTERALKTLRSENDKLHTTLTSRGTARTTPVVTSASVKSSSDGWTLTYYNALKESTGKNPGDSDFGITKSGRRVEDGVTIAVDPKLIPLGTWVRITLPNGTVLKRRADDTGGAIKGKKIDVYVNASTKAIYRDYGKVTGAKVEILK